MMPSDIAAGFHYERIVTRAGTKFWFWAAQEDLIKLPERIDPNLGKTSLKKLNGNQWKVTLCYKID